MEKKCLICKIKEIALSSLYYESNTWGDSNDYWVYLSECLKAIFGETTV